jgi:hypothetical protein
MNKYLMMSAAALLAATASAVNASAGEQHFTFGTTGGGSYCDGGIGQWSGYVYGWVHTNYDCAGRNAVGNPGIAGKTAGIGKNVNMSDASFFSDNLGYICSYDFPNKFKIGGTWSLWCSFSGSLATEVNSGILLSSNAKAPGGTKSTLSAVKALVAERRSRDESKRVQ